MSWSADVFHVGPQKTGTTWVYRCFREHPEIATTQTDATHYYSMLYHKGEAWYKSLFDGQGIYFDPTPNYLRSPLAAGRIAGDNPDAKIIICVRNPIERAFSHYWHEKKKNRFNFTFDEVLENFDLFSNWVEPGLYSVHIKRFLDHFPPEQVKVTLFDDMESSPQTFIRDLFTFAGVDAGFVPSIVDQKVNVAKPRQQFGGPFGVIGKARRAMSMLGVMGGPDMESLDDVDERVVEELSVVLEEELRSLEEMLHRDLATWRVRQ